MGLRSSLPEMGRSERADFPREKALWLQSEESLESSDWEPGDGWVGGSFHRRHGGDRQRVGGDGHVRCVEVRLCPVWMQDRWGWQVGWGHCLQGCGLAGACGVAGGSDLWAGAVWPGADQFADQQRSLPGWSHSPKCIVSQTTVGMIYRK